MEPRLPNLPTPDLRWKFYGESATDDIIRKLLIARNVARQNNEDASDAAQMQYDSKAVPHKFLPNQLVLLDEHSFLHKNQKLAPKFVRATQNYLPQRRCKRWNFTTAQ